MCSLYQRKLSLTLYEAISETNENRLDGGGMLKATEGISRSFHQLSQMGQGVLTSSDICLSPEVLLLGRCGGVEVVF